MSPIKHFWQGLTQATNNPQAADYTRVGRRTVIAVAGFTIIEVLIVLAIAGLILLIVFLAVPALQRNSRNTQYNTEAARILGGTQEFINNNGGGLPATSVSTTAGSNAATILGNANPKNITTLDVTNPAVAGTISATVSHAYLEIGATCPNPNVAPSIVFAASNVAPTAPARSIVVVYVTETSSGSLDGQCVAS